MELLIAFLLFLIYCAFRWTCSAVLVIRYLSGASAASAVDVVYAAEVLRLRGYRL